MNADNLQRALYDALTGDVTLMALITGVYADVQQPDLPESDSNFPYVVIGQDNLSPFDTKTDNGASALCQLDIWSRQNNLIEVKEIAGAIYDVLQKGSLNITGADHVLTRIESQTFSKDPDGQTKRGMVMARVVYDEIT